MLFSLVGVGCLVVCVILSGSTLLPYAAEAFYAFMAQRERGRIRKEVLHLPRTQWYTGVWSSMADIRLTNVRRSADATTQLIAATVGPVGLGWHRSSCQQWRTRCLGLFVFHSALWRTFGAQAFVSEYGFNPNLFSWDPAAWQQVARAAQRARERSGSAFTDAYGPARYSRLREKNLHDATAVYLDVCATLTTIWEARFLIVRACASQSWKHVVATIRKVLGWNGTGFRAKELALDLMLTPAFPVVDDFNQYCPLGPGARRGLNRLHGRPVTATSSEDVLLQELLTIYALRHQYWDTSRFHALSLHDLQFQLCEIDKWLRYLLAEGWCRPYAARALL